MQWMTLDPGETTGWSLWEGDRLIFANQTPMWEHIRLVDGLLSGSYAGKVQAWDDLGMPYEPGQKIELGALVCEDWQLYPDVIAAGGLDWDKCRTARAIGAYTLLAEQHRIPFELQGALIKDAAMRLGAREKFLRPQDENRHANDAIMHGVYFLGRWGHPPC